MARCHISEMCGVADGDLDSRRKDKTSLPAPDRAVAPHCRPAGVDLLIASGTALIKRSGPLPAIAIGLAAAAHLSDMREASRPLDLVYRLPTRCSLDPLVCDMIGTGDVGRLPCCISVPQSTPCRLVGEMDGARLMFLGTRRKKRKNCCMDGLVRYFEQAWARGGWVRRSRSGKRGFNMRHQDACASLRWLLPTTTSFDMPRANAIMPLESIRVPYTYFTIGELVFVQCGNGSHQLNALACACLSLLHPMHWNSSCHCRHVQMQSDCRIRRACEECRLPSPGSSQAPGAL